MAALTELAILKKEEAVLKKIASELNDQLNRLKVRIFEKLPGLSGSIQAISWLNGVH